MRLWTLQSPQFWEALQRKPRVRAKWKRVCNAVGWLPAFVWMSREMVRRGICRRPVAPIWAWHSCGAPGNPPSWDDIVALCGTTGESGYEIELDAPDELVLLSRYDVWNQILDECVDVQHDPSKLDPERSQWERVFRIELERAAEDDDFEIQACLPYVDRDWVRSVVAYRLPEERD